MKHQTQVERKLNAQQKMSNENKKNKWGPSQQGAQSPLL